MQKYYNKSRIDKKLRFNFKLKLFRLTSNKKCVPNFSTRIFIVSLCGDLSFHLSDTFHTHFDSCLVHRNEFVVTLGK